MQYTWLMPRLTGAGDVVDVQPALPGLEILGGNFRDFRHRLQNGFQNGFFLHRRGTEARRERLFRDPVLLF
jgi:hypothetical protein